MTGLAATMAMAAILALTPMPRALAEDANADPAAKPIVIHSPSGQIQVQLSLSGSGQPRYRVDYAGQEVVAPSTLGLRFLVAPPLDEDLDMAELGRRQVRERWEQPWGERRVVLDHYDEVLVRFQSADQARGLDLRVRAFDDGIGFRYEVPPQGDRARLAIVDELTEFRLPPDARAWWIPGRRYNRYEYLYRETAVDAIEQAHTPLTARLENDVHVSLHEAALVDYAAYVLDQRRPGVLKVDLTPWSDGVRVRRQAPFHSPWRTIQIAPGAAALLNSSLILNLNEPNALGDVSWVQPGKYIGIWWAMHLGERTWGRGEKHGATTQEARRYIDFAAENGFDGVLVEGWNVGWDGEWFNNGDVFDFVQPTDDFDLKAVAAYARDKGVRLIGHHETSGSVSHYETQMHQAYDLYQSLGVTQVKTGYVADGGDIRRRDADGVPRYEWHDGQYMVNHYLRSVKAAASRKIAINTHEPIKDTGLRRTYPNWLTREGARGQEFNAWGTPPNPPEHTAILPFTRLLSGPMDFTPGIFDLTFKGADAEHRVSTTLAKQLALYVVIYSPVQMAADLPENYPPRPDGFQFIREVPTDWEQSVALAGEVGQYVVMARQRRGGADWYLGALTNALPRALEVPLDFLPEGVAYNARVYADGPDAHWKRRPHDLQVVEKSVKHGETLSLKLAPGGGAAVTLRPETGQSRPESREESHP